MELGLPEVPDRLVEFFVTVGLGDELVPITTNEADEPIVDLCVVEENKAPPDDSYRQVAFTVSGGQADLNRGGRFFSSTIYLYLKRGRDRPPVTDVTVIYPELGERCPPGFIRCNVNLNKGSYGRSIYLCFSTKAKLAPIVDVAVVSSELNEQTPAGYTLLRKNLNAGSFREELYFCVRRSKRSAFSTFYKPVILDRFPRQDVRESKLPHALAMFCHPDGCRLVRDTPPLPSSSTFVLTVRSGLRLFGACLTFHEPWTTGAPSSSSPSNSPPSASSSSPDADEPEPEPSKIKRVLSRYLEHNRDRSVWAPKTICIVSYWPYYDGFSRFLGELYRISVGQSRLPIERYLTNLWETPLPRTSDVQVRLTIGHQRITFSRPSDDDFPLADFAMKRLFQQLSVDTIYKILSAILLERKVVLCSNNRGVLTPIGESLRLLLFPFEWQYAYIPLLPRFVGGILEAPMPILVGVHTDNISQKLFELDDACILDIDNDRIVNLGQDIVELPSKLLKTLTRNLHKVARVPMPSVGPRDPLEDLSMFGSMAPTSSTPNSHSPAMDRMAADTDGDRFNQTACRASFLSFFIELLGDCTSFLTFPVIQDRQAAFTDLILREQYIASLPRSSRAFMSLFTDTQMFAHYVDERTYSSRRQPQLDFYDRCAKYEEARMRAASRVSGPTTVPSLVLYLTERRQQRLVYEVPRPESVGLPQASFTYDEFPKLDLTLFRRPRPVDPRCMVETHKDWKRNVTSFFDSAFASKSESQPVRPHSGAFPAKFSSPHEWAQFMLREVYGTWFQLQVASISAHLDPRKVIVDMFVRLDRIVSFSIVPDEGIYRAVLIVCGRFHCSEEARVVFETMKNFGVTPSAVTYGAYAHALAEATEEEHPPPAVLGAPSKSAVHAAAASPLSTLAGPLLPESAHSEVPRARSLQRSYSSTSFHAKTKRKKRRSRKDSPDSVEAARSDAEAERKRERKHQRKQRKQHEPKSALSVDVHSPSTAGGLKKMAVTPSVGALRLGAKKHKAKKPKKHTPLKRGKSATHIPSAAKDDSDALSTKATLSPTSMQRQLASDPFALADVTPADEDSSSLTSLPSAHQTDRSGDYLTGELLSQLDVIDLGSVQLGLHNTCSSCHGELSESEITAGWSDNPNVYTSKCTLCNNSLNAPKMQVRYRRRMLRSTLSQYSSLESMTVEDMLSEAEAVVDAEHQAANAAAASSTSRDGDDAALEEELGVSLSLGTATRVDAVINLDDSDTEATSTTSGGSLPLSILSEEDSASTTSGAEGHPSDAELQEPQQSPGASRARKRQGQEQTQSITVTADPEAENGDRQRAGQADQALLAPAGVSPAGSLDVSSGTDSEAVLTPPPTASELADDDVSMSSGLDASPNNAPTTGSNSDSFLSSSVTTTSDDGLSDSDSSSQQGSAAAQWSYVQFEIPFLSPISLRKELNLATRAFYDDFQKPQLIRCLHRVLYWNMVWHFTNMDLPLDALIPVYKSIRFVLSEFPAEDVPALRQMELSGIESLPFLPSTVGPLPPFSASASSDSIQPEDHDRLLVDSIRREIADGHLQSAMVLFLQRRTRLLLDTPPQSKAKEVPTEARPRWLKPMFRELDAIGGDLVGTVEEFAAKYKTAFAALDLEYRNQLTDADDVPSRTVLACETVFHLGREETRFDPDRSPKMPSDEDVL